MARNDNFVEECVEHIAYAVRRLVLHGVEAVAGVGALGKLRLNTREPSTFSEMRPCPAIFAQVSFKRCSPQASLQDTTANEKIRPDLALRNFHRGLTCYPGNFAVTAQFDPKMLAS